MPTDPAEIAYELRTQDNAGTSHPLFIVEQRDRVYGVDSAYTDSFEWIDSDDNVTADAESAADLDAEYRETLREPEGWRRVGYIDRWRFVTACLTRKGCEDYIAANGRNLESPRIYVASAHRNPEWQAVRELLS